MNGFYIFIGGIIIRKKSLKEFLSEIEKNNMNEFDIYQEINSEYGNEEDNIVKAEKIAFYFRENKDEFCERGNYFLPFLEFKGKDGEKVDIPSVDDITSEMIDYWTKRIHETNNPIFKARYSGLVWEFCHPVKKESPDPLIGKIYVESLIDLVENKNIQLIHVRILKIERALSLVLRLNLNEYHARIEKNIIDLEKEIFSGFSLEIIENQPNFKFDKEEEIVKILKKDLYKNINDNKTKSHYLKNLALNLANYYRNRNDNNSAKKIIRDWGNSLLNEKSDYETIPLMYHIQEAIRLYQDFGVKKEDTDKLHLKLQELGRKRNEEMGSISTQIEISNEEMNNLINHYTQGTPKDILFKLAGGFIPDTEDIKKSLEKQIIENPFSSMLPSEIVNDEGLPIAKLKPLNEDLDSHVNKEVNRSLYFQKIFFQPVFEKIRKEHILSKEDIISFLEKSPLFEKDDIFLKNFVDMYFNNDSISAIHLIVPQIENAFRRLIQLNNGNIIKANNYGGHYYISLGDLLRNPIISQIYNEKIQIYFIVLLVDPMGWNIRNNVSHGLVNSEFFSNDILDRLLHILLLLGILRSKIENT